jgi:3-methylfumaryl-CoA hydratase
MSETAESLDLEYLCSWIGREEAIQDVVTDDLIRKFRATFGLSETSVGGTGETAPRLIHFCLAQPAASTFALGMDGHPKRGGFLPPVMLPRRMWAGGRLRFHRDLRHGDLVRRVSRIEHVALKEGRTGSLCFVTVAHRLEVDGCLAIEETQDIVYRGLSNGEGAKRPISAEVGCHQYRFSPSPVLLFRYSALTFNGHRIHYDARYVTEVEGYPGLVVHGPLQATLLYNYAADICGSPPASFGFRSLSALFDNRPFLLHADADGKRLKLWTAEEGGPVAMVAEAEWS